MAAGLQEYAWPAFTADGPVRVVENEAGTVQVKAFRVTVNGRPIGER